MATNALQPRRYSGQKKANMRGRAELPAPRTSFYKRGYIHGSRNAVGKNENRFKHSFYILRK